MFFFIKQLLKDLNFIFGSNSTTFFFKLSSIVFLLLTIPTRDVDQDPQFSVYILQIFEKITYNKIKKFQCRFLTMRGKSHLSFM